MSIVFGFKVIRSYKSPVAEYSFLTSDPDRLAIEFLPRYHGNAFLSDSLGLIVEFLQSVDIDGLAILEEFEPTQGSLLYEIEGKRSLLELLQNARSPLGTRAALELVGKICEVLVETSYAASMYAIEAHGNLCFQNILLHEDGRIQLLNYGIPSLDVIDYKNSLVNSLPVETLRFAPPERLNFEPEDGNSDAFSLSLMLFYFITGQDLYQGNEKEVAQQAKSGIPYKNILQYDLHPSIVSLLSKSLRPNPFERFYNLEEFQEELQKLSPESFSGKSLKEFLQHIHSDSAEETPAESTTQTPEQKQTEKAQEEEQRLKEEEEKLKEEEERLKEEERKREEEERRKLEAEEQRLREEEERLQREEDELKRIQEEHERRIQEEEERLKREEERLKEEEIALQK
ncbi:MAG: protein kinase, partial [Myxococcota bacterium]|nr:protein kinase [Myxococcota bacterium]